jgi:hypothetical protein
MFAKAFIKEDLPTFDLPQKTISCPE